MSKSTRDLFPDLTPPPINSEADQSASFGAALDASTLRGGVTPCHGSSGANGPDTLRRSGSSSDTGPLLPGEQIDSYVVEKFVGCGAMGSVYKASSAKFPNHRVALKILSDGYYPSYHALVDEAGQHAQLSGHTHIVQIIDIGEVAPGQTHAGLRYLVMEFIEGEALDKYDLDELGSIVDRLNWFKQVASAIGYAHAKNIVHRDLKPPNIMITKAPVSGIAKVVDFGIAVAVSKSVASQEGAPDQHYLGGTRGYIRRGRMAASRAKYSVEPADDVYSLGVTLYQLIAGFTTHPYQYSESKDAPYFPAKATSHIPADLLGPLNALIQASTEGGGVAPAPANGGQFYDALSSIIADYQERQLQTQRQTAADRVAQDERVRYSIKRRQLLAIGAALFVVLGVGVAVRDVVRDVRTGRRTDDEYRLRAAALSKKNEGALPLSNLSDLLLELSLRGDRPVARSLLRDFVRDLFFLPNRGAECGPANTAVFRELSPDRRFALLLIESKAVLWDCYNNKERAKLPQWHPFNSASPSSDRLQAKYFSGDSKWFLGADDPQLKRRACRWSTAQPEQLARCTGTLLQNIERAALSDDGQTALIVAKESGAQLWDLDHYKLLCDLAKDLPSIVSAVLSGDAQVVTAGGATGQIISWWRDGQTYKKLQSNPLQLDSRPDAVRLLVLSTDKRWLAASYGGHTLWLTQTQDPEPTVVPIDLVTLFGARAKPKVETLVFTDTTQGLFLLAGIQSGLGAVLWPISLDGAQLKLGAPTTFSEPARSIDTLALSSDAAWLIGASSSAPGVTAWAHDGTRLWGIGSAAVRWVGSVNSTTGSRSEVTVVLQPEGAPPQVWNLDRSVRYWVSGPPMDLSDKPAASCSPLSLARLLAHGDPKENIAQFSQSIQACVTAAWQENRRK